MIKIKLTTPWAHDYLAQTPELTGALGDYHFEINNDCRECDYWIIWGGLNKPETIKCSTSNIIYITDEVHNLRKYNQEFLDQFPLILSVRTDLKHRKIIKVHDPHIWYFNKTYDELSSMSPIQKRSELSVVCSDIIVLPGHKKRYAFVHKMIGHFKDRLQVFGRGFNPIEDKWDAIAPYKYSIAIENNVMPGYFTEKLTECFLSYTIPIYYGCPDIEEYFNSKSMILIDIDDYKKSIETIEKALADNYYEQNFECLLQSRRKFLKELHVFPMLVDLINKNQGVFDKHPKTINTIIPEKYYIEKDEYSDFLRRTGVKKSFKFFFDTLKMETVLKLFGTKNN